MHAMQSALRSSLGRFLQALEQTYEQALQEITHGEKKMYWIWFVRPQLPGLSHSAMASEHGLRDRATALA